MVHAIDPNKLKVKNGILIYTLGETKFYHKKTVDLPVDKVRKLYGRVLDRGVIDFSFWEKVRGGNLTKEKTKNYVCKATVFSTKSVLKAKTADLRTALLEESYRMLETFFGVTARILTEAIAV